LRRPSTHIASVSGVNANAANEAAFPGQIDDQLPGVCYAKGMTAFDLVLAMTRIGYPQSGLTALLNALERELLAAHADEVRDAWGDALFCAIQICSLR
jgi:hypothetical protein